MKLLLLFLLIPASLFAQSLQGKVLGTNKEGLAFTSIWVENTNQGTLANEDGQFDIHLKPGKSKLVFRHLGYSPKLVEVDLGNNEVQKALEVVM